MKTTLQQPGNNTFFQVPVVQEKTAETDTVGSYSDFLSDSLNMFHADSVFRFELKEIILPADDSLTTTDQVVYNTPSIFTSPGKSQNAVPTARNQDNYDWLTGLFLICLIIFAWIRVYNTRRIKQLFKAVIARHHVNQLMRDGNLTEERLAPGLVFIFLISVSTMIFQLGYSGFEHWLGIYDPVLIFLIILGSIAVLWLMKILAIKGTGKIFRSRHDTGELIITNLIFNATAGMVIFPLVLAGFYIENPLILKIAAGMLLVLILLRFVRSLSVGIAAQTFSVLYLFLYLCTLEILPVIFLYRWVTLAN